MTVMDHTDKEFIPEPPDSNGQNIDAVDSKTLEIIDFLTDNQEICFKSQQRGERDLTVEEKSTIALKILNKSKVTFLQRFGRYLNVDRLQYFDQYANLDNDENCEVSIVLNDLKANCSKTTNSSTKNRRFEALKMMKGEHYFTELEMMKRNPLLYEQLVGQYLSVEEKKERDRYELNEGVTFVKILMEGIERDDAVLKKREQENVEETDVMKEEDGDSSDDDETFFEPGSGQDSKPGCSLWGEFDGESKRQIRKPKIRGITEEERDLLREEFVSTMYRSFLDGKDEDFDYSTVDDDPKYDNMDIIDNDEEDKYFDSEDPVDRDVEKEVSSEDELDVYMSALNENPYVQELSKNMAENNI